MVGVRFESREPVFREKVGDALHALPTEPDAARDRRHGASRSNGHQYIPTRPGLLLVSRYPLALPRVETGKLESFLEDSLRRLRMWQYDNILSS